VRNRGRLLLILGPLILLLGGGGAAYFFFFNKRPAKAAPQERTCELTLSDLTVNLADTDRPHYLSASVSLVLKGVNPEAVVEERELEVRDAVIIVMTQHVYADLLSAEGKEILKSDIALAVEEALSEGRLAVEDVLFTSFLMD
jgi:flagellar FliL protein